MPRSAGISISPVDALSPYVQDLKNLVSSYAALNRAQGGGGKGSDGKGKVTGTGKVYNPLTGESVDVPLHGSKDERKSELKALQQEVVQQALAQKLQDKNIGELDNMSVSKRQRTIQEMESSIARELALKAPMAADVIRDTVSNTFAPHREETARRRKAVDEASSLDAIGSSLSSAWDYVKGMLPQSDLSLAQHNKEAAQRAAANRAQNAYLEDQYRMSQEGSGAWDRTMGENGRLLTNLLTGGIEMAPALGATVGAAALGGIGGTALGGPAGSIAGAAAGAGAIGAATARNDLMQRLALEHPDWTAEQLAAAADQGDGRAMLTGAVTNAALYNAGRVVPFIKGFRNTTPVARTAGAEAAEGAAAQAPGFWSRLNQRVAGGAAAADAATAVRPTGFFSSLPGNFKRAALEVTPMSLGYQVGQNWAYNNAVGQENTLDNLSHGLSDAALASLGFAGGLATGRSAFTAGKAALNKSNTTPTPDANKVDAEANKATNPDEVMAKQKLEQQVEQVKNEVNIDDPEAAKKGTYELLRSSDLDEAKKHIASLQHLRESIAAIKQNMDGYSDVNPAVKAYIDAMADIEATIGDTKAGGEAGKKARTRVQNFINGLVKFLRGNKKDGRIEFDGSPEAVANLRTYIQNKIPDGIPPAYLDYVMGELPLPKDKRNSALKYVWGKVTSSLNDAERNAIAHILNAYRASRNGDVMRNLEQAKQMAQDMQNLQNAANGDPNVQAAAATGDGGTGASGQNMVPDGQPGEAVVDTTNNSANSELGANPAAVVDPAANASPEASGGNNTNTPQRGTGGPEKQNNSQTPPVTGTNETGKSVSPNGGKGRPDTEQATAGNAAAGEGAGSPAPENGGLAGNNGNAKPTGTPDPANISNAGDDVKLGWHERAIQARVLPQARAAFDAEVRKDPQAARQGLIDVLKAHDEAAQAGKDGNPNDVMLSDLYHWIRRRVSELTDWQKVLEDGKKAPMLEAMTYGSSFKNYAALQTILDNNTGLSAKAQNRARGLMDTIAKKYPELKAQQDNNPTPVSSYVTTGAELDSAVRLAQDVFDRAKANTTIATMTRQMLKNPDVSRQAAYDGLLSFANTDTTLPAQRDRAIDMANRVVKDAAANGETIKQTPEQIRLIDAVCGN